jgi:hypothetical protein
LHSGERPALLCISQSFAPDTTPTAIRASKLLEHLSARWDITVLSEADGARGDSRVAVEVVRSWRPRRLFALLRRLRLSKLLELGVWPDESIFWVAPAVLAGRRIVRERRPRAIVVFMMPYSAGLAGIVLSRLQRLPLILNLDDSLTCTDMHPHFPTRLHYRLAKALEDLYVRCADEVIYVSATNLEAVRARQPQGVGEKLHLVRYGADATDFSARVADGAATNGAARDEAARGMRVDHGAACEQTPAGVPARERRFEIAYVGAMSGWWTLIEAHAPPPGIAKRIYNAWVRLGRYELMALDQRTSSPEVIGHAIIDAIAEHSDWAGRVGLTLYGNPYAADVVAQALASAGVQDVVTVLDPVAHAQVAGILAGADLLFLTLPGRTDGSRGGRISAKTYEYLMTDRPILAALPRGENWDYLADKPGVWLVEPDDRERMQEVIADLAQAKFAGSALTFDRSELADDLSYEGRATEFEAVVNAGIERGGGRRRAA